MLTLRHVVDILQCVSRRFKRSKRLELQNLAQLCEVRETLLHRVDVHADFLGLEAFKQRKARRRLEEDEHVGLFWDKGSSDGGDWGRGWAGGGPEKEVDAAGEKANSAGNDPVRIGLSKDENKKSPLCG